MSTSMKNLTKIGTVTAIFAQSLIANATPIAQDLQSCAVAALAERQQTAKLVTVKTGGLTRAELDRDRSVKRDEYLMLITDRSSGKKLGIVSCSLNFNGDIIAASFNS